MDKDLQYILGALGDGCIYINRRKRDYRVIIVQKSRDWLENSLSPRFNKIFGVKAVIRRRRDGLWELRIYSKKVVQALLNYLGNLNDVELDTYYVAGFYDAEGDKSLKRVRMWSEDVDKLRVIAKILEKYAIGCNIYLDDKRHYVYCLEVPTRFKLRFLKLIPLEHPMITSHAPRPREFRRA